MMRSVRSLTVFRTTAHAAFVPTRLIRRIVLTDAQAAGYILLRAVGCMSVCIFLAAFSTGVNAYTPDDPQVVAMVNKGIAYLEKSSHKGLEGEYEGGHILVGYTVYKVTGDKDHPLVKAGIKVALQRADDSQTRPRGIHKIVYDASMAALFLADLDAVQYRPQLIRIREFLRYQQKKNGGYGYLDSERGDTSQTQYAMLALWAMHKSDIDVPSDMIDPVMRYLIATQDPKGGWGYQAIMPTNGQLVAQDMVSKSLGTAGICATLIGADVLGLLGKRVVAEEDPDIPKAFTRIDLLEKQRAKLKNNSTSIRQDELTNTVARAADYQRVNPYSPVGRGWLYYYRYSEERYESFLEVMNGKAREKSPAWYNAGVTELKRLQDAEGAWGTLNSDFCPPDVCTAFAILYLIRSTQKTIAKLNEGLMAGGYGLPSDAGTVRRVGDRIVSEQTASVDGLLELMEKDNTDSVEVGLLPENLALSKDPAIRKAQVTRLGRLISSRDWKSRRIAAKLLGRSEDINQVPELIYALTDTDPEVPVLAEESLRLLTRKLTVRHVELESTPEQKREAANYWRNWYSTMRPDYVFIDK